MITFLLCSLLVWGFVGPVYCSSSDHIKGTIISANKKQEAVVILVAGPIVWFVVIVEALFRFIFQALDKGVSRLMKFLEGKPSEDKPNA